MKSFTLEQNYPNPFKATTTISYQIPESGNVILKIYDVLGRVVKTLVNASRQSGVYSVEFNGSRLTHNYRAVAEWFMTTEKTTQRTIIFLQ